MIEGVVFDKDGTLFDFRQSWGGWSARLLDSLATDKDHAKRMAASIGYDAQSNDFHPDSPVIAATAREISAALLPHLPEFSMPTLIARLNAMAEVTVMTEAVPLRPTLDALRQSGLRLGLATNDTEAPARAHLATHDILDLFDFVAGCDSGFGAKPGSGMPLAFAKKTGIDPARIVMVGDSRHDLIAGRDAGMRTVGVLTGIATEQELAAFADVVLTDIGRLADWIAIANSP